MADKMTLKQVRDWHRGREHDYKGLRPNSLSKKHGKMADALDAHIAAMGEPVGWMTKSGRVINTETRERVLANAELGGEYVVAAKAAESYKIPLYTAPPASGDWEKVREVIAQMREKPTHIIELDWADKLEAALPEDAK